MIAMTTATLPTVTTVTTSTRREAAIQKLGLERNWAVQRLTQWMQEFSTTPVDALRSQRTIHDAAWTLRIVDLCVWTLKTTDALSDADALAAVIAELDMWHGDGVRNLLTTERVSTEYRDMEAAKAREAQRIQKILSRI